jgi:hypothetical protein
MVEGAARSTHTHASKGCGSAEAVYLVAYGATLVSLFLELVRAAAQSLRFEPVVMIIAFGTIAMLMLLRNYHVSHLLDDADCDFGKYLKSLPLPILIPERLMRLAIAIIVISSTEQTVFHVDMVYTTLWDYFNAAATPLVGDFYQFAHIDTSPAVFLSSQSISILAPLTLSLISLFLIMLVWDSMIVIHTYGSKKAPAITAVNDYILSTREIRDGESPLVYYLSSPKASERLSGLAFCLSVTLFCVMQLSLISPAVSVVLGFIYVNRARANREYLDSFAYFGTSMVRFLTV